MSTLAEIEQALLAHPTVSAAMVTAHTHAGDTRLVAYLACSQQPTPAQLVAFLRERLPAFMVPAAFVLILQQTLLLVVPD